MASKQPAANQQTPPQGRSRDMQNYLSRVYATTAFLSLAGWSGVMYANMYSVYDRRGMPEDMIVTALLFILSLILVLFMDPLNRLRYVALTALGFLHGHLISGTFYWANYQVVAYAFLASFIMLILTSMLTSMVVESQTPEWRMMFMTIAPGLLFIMVIFHGLVPLPIRIYMLVGFFLFFLFVAYDTQKIKLAYEEGYDDPVLAALQFYVDMMVVVPYNLILIAAFLKRRGVVVMRIRRQ